jgi:hypothetical protein
MENLKAKGLTMLDRVNGEGKLILQNNFALKVSKFQNEIMKTSFLQKYEANIFALYCGTVQGRNPYNF